MAAGRGSRPSGVPETSGRAAVSRPVCTALRRQGHLVAWAAGPRHRRPRLHYEIHRRGGASAVSRPPQARARTDGSVRQAAQRSADRSVQPRSQGRCAAGLPPPCAGLPGDVLPPVGAATRSNSRCALPHLAAPQGAHEGRHRRRCALPVPWMPLAPSPTHGGFANRCAPEGKRLRRTRRGRRPPPCTELFGLHLTLCGLACLLA